MREIVYDRDVSQDVEAARQSFRLVDEAMQGIEWTLSRNPQAGSFLSGRFWVYVQRGVKAHRIPEIVVLYSFNNEQVILHGSVFRPMP